MKKNLLVQEAADAISARVEKLNSRSLPLWGKMNVSEMLLHCNLCNRETLEGTNSGRKTSARQYVLRLFALYLLPKYLKGIKSDAANIAKGKAGATDLEQQKQECIELIKKFPLVNHPLTLSHHVFGNISTHQWGIAAYKHMDHHLRQFGV